MTRTHTPPRRNADGSETYTVQRACNGCGRGIGDVTANELDAAIDGATLPDVRDECGCSNPVVQSIAKAMCDVDHDWDFPCRNCTAAAVPPDRDRGLARRRRRRRPHRRRPRDGDAVSRPLNAGTEISDDVRGGNAGKIHRTYAWVTK